MAHDEFKIGEHHYRIGRLNARQQFDVARRLSFVLVQLGGEKNPEFKPTAENFARIILVTTGSVPQSDMDTALNICLSAVTRQMGGDRGYAAVVAGNGAMMFEDIDMSAMLQIVWHVIDQHRLVDFLSAGVRKSAEA